MRKSCGVGISCAAFVSKFFHFWFCFYSLNSTTSVEDFYEGLAQVRDKTGTQKD